MHVFAVAFTVCMSFVFDPFLVRYIVLHILLRMGGLVDIHLLYSCCRLTLF